MLGKPEIGYAAARRLTRQEALITGMSTRTLIQVDTSGRVTFWFDGYDGGLNTARQSSQAVEALEAFWAK